VILCYINRKGGCSKTGLSVHSAGTLAAINNTNNINNRICICDLDPQSSASQILLSSKTVESLPKHRTISALFDSRYDPTPEQIVHPTEHPRISIIPSTNDLTEHNLPLTPTPASKTNLTPFLQELSTEYTHIICDCPPNLQFCSWAALLACRSVILAVVPESPSTQGLIYVNRVIEQARVVHPSLSVLGMILTLYNRNLSIHRTYESALRREYGPVVFETPMILSTVFKESVANRKPVEVYAPKSAAALAMRLIVAEMLTRAGEQPDYKPGDGSDTAQNGEGDDGHEG
jgi:chromosome partitioning protein